ncbi:hypothetical protein BurJ1DRAFT_4029 [Burkholderiales bacterium JOSHI_001]|nr:hypothetical protein BurJ1DRAFT_4029 [Burkholderiales bacterium JOSHI_001]
MRPTFPTLLAALLAAGLVACGGGDNADPHAGAPAAADTEAVRSEQIAAVLPETDPAMRIAHAGHGKMFDAKMQPIEASAKFIEQVQLSVRDVALKATGGQFDEETMIFMKMADELTASGKLSETDRLVLQGGVVWKMLRGVDPKLFDRYEWRLEVANQHLQDVFKPGTFQISPQVLELLRKFEYLDLWRRVPWFFSYAKRCDTNGVPVPPDFATSGTAWVNRGPLHHNILDGSSGTADVYSWSDPGKRGACIALPRNSGSLAGIICQSATTGAACFWDNIDAATNTRLDWRTQTLRIAELKNGSNLAENCTNCHRGNNVFQLAPDDSTWAKLLRPMPGTVGPTLTLRVESSSDNRGGRPRYFPVTGLFGRAGWENVYNSSTTCSSCHERPAAAVESMNLPPMPPACAALVGGCGS